MLAEHVELIDQIRDLLADVDWGSVLTGLLAGLAAWWAKRGRDEGRVTNGAGTKEAGMPVVLDELHRMHDRLDQHMEKRGIFGRHG